MRDVITIDGPSGAGKGTIARLLARELGYTYLDTGALYRAVAWKVRKERIALDNKDALQDILDSTEIIFENDKIIVDGNDISAEIRTAAIGELSSQVSALSMVRDGLYKIQREMCLKGRIVIEGRDTGTAICREAKYKIYLDASLEERARRRYRDLRDHDPALTPEKTIEDLKKRDLRDSTRTFSPLKRTDDMLYIDSSALAIDEVVKKILEHVR